MSIFVLKIKTKQAYTFGKETLEQGLPIASLMEAINAHPLHVQRIVDAFMSELLAARTPE